MNRDEFVAHVTRRFDVKAEYPFSHYPNFAVFRHAENRKWFAVVMTIPQSKLIADAEGMIDVVNLKCAEEILDTLWQERGIYPAYHMGRGCWISAALDGSLPPDTLNFLLGVSFELTGRKGKKRR